MDATTLDIEIPLAERAYRELRRAIVRCEYEPGQRLRVDDLGKKFEISNSPIREALSRLAEQGLVRSIDNRGFRVAPLTVEGISDLTRIRLLIECEALRDAIAHGGDAWETAMVAAAHSLSLIEQRLGDDPVALDNNWSERHRSFHLAIYSGCSSPLLKEMVAQLFDSAERYRRYSASHRQTDRGKHDEHNKLLQCVLTRDVDAAVEFLSHHIKATQKTVTQALMALSVKK
jgi:GntR family carbon starvation induced transcriptional regulator